MTAAIAIVPGVPSEEGARSARRRAERRVARARGPVVDSDVPPAKLTEADLAQLPPSIRNRLVGVVAWHRAGRVGRPHLHHEYTRVRLGRPVDVKAKRKRH